ncbi:lysophospholipid acyltransferase family protein [Alkalihalobacillus pseudalcaliphilus]|uniref:lysophospholipid acyltransferase family protein n=1 Tax=Alkalihalobacillus pseudalcaliphilus TaxID=79884 RepID=UPI00069E231D|nr:lysophospholipid acyltransferase family protein [Alkalihalobacillus pseudalcaliphilus]
MRNFIVYGHAVLFFIAIIPIMLWLKTKDPEIRYKKTNQLAEKIASKTLKLAGTKVEVDGLDNIKENEHYLYISNHQGNFDIPLLLAHVNRDLSFIAKESLQKVPLFGLWMTHKMCIFINRENPRQAVRQLAQAGEMVQNGKPVSIFPEGHRSKGDKMGDFGNSGSRIAKKSGVKILPITIDGSYRIMEELDGKFQPTTVKIVVHKAIDTTDFSSLSDLNEQVESVIQSALPSA